ncbi:hypothetical protein EYF80_008257 [Liparis tanakae]|uniref:Uncharacterized protein n=1 Tax=Liparis tanakae TaxID=230148 RepID=A0A4Z2IU97_9TELE|nr:hypothetical protein EYF80_008257 [Liparis tanakae]
MAENSTQGPALDSGSVHPVFRLPVHYHTVGNPLESSGAELARSQLAGVTARIKQLSLVMNCMIMSRICCSMSTGWSPTGTFVIPGSVREGDELRTVRGVNTQVDGDGGDAFVGPCDTVRLCLDLLANLIEDWELYSRKHGALPCTLTADHCDLRQVQVAGLADGAEGILQLVDQRD